MRKVSLLLLTPLLLSMFGFFPRSAYAMCAESLTLQEYRKQADIVIVGTATIVVDDDAFISVNEYFKGHGPDTIRVTGSASDSGESSVDFKLESQKKYLLFLKFTDTDQLRTNACLGNKELGDEGLSAADKSALGKSKITPIMLEKFNKPASYVISRPATILMIISGAIIFLLLLLSILKQKRKRSEKKPQKGKKKK